MLKDLEEYNETYGDVPESYSDRIKLLRGKFNKKDFGKLKDLITSISSIRRTKLDFIFYMIPKATPRARLGKSGVFYVKDASFNSSMFKSFLEEHEEIKHIINTPCKIKMVAYFPPNGLNKINTLLGELKLIYPISIPDVDNIAKTYMDMIQKHLLLNDSLVYDLHVSKYYSIKPRIELSITYLNEFECKYNEKKVSNWKK